MNAIHFLREMHAETRLRLKRIVAVEDPAQAAQQWQALRPLLDLHEQLEDRFLYAPLATEVGPGTPLGDWAERHDGDVAVINQLLAGVDDAAPGAPEWRTAVGRVTDALSRHVMVEEGQIFGRIEQAWDPKRLERAGSEMRKELRDVAEATGALVAQRRS